MKNVVLGSGGLLGSALLRQLTEQSADGEVIGFSREDLNANDIEALQAMFETQKPSIVWNCIGYNNVDAAESNPAMAKGLNTEIPELLATLCKEHNAVLIHFSSGYVFDGNSESGYAEDATPNPQSEYARSKYAGEQVVTEVLSAHYIIRLNWLFGLPGLSKHSKQTFPDMVLKLAAQLAPLRMVNDEFATPTYAEDLVSAAIDLVAKKMPFGIYHICNDGKASWYEFAQETLRLNHIDHVVEPIAGASLERLAKRPKNATLLNTKLSILRDWREALAAYYTERT